MPDGLLTRIDGVELARAGRWPTSTGVWDASPEDFAAAVAALACPAIEDPKIWIGHTDQRFTPRKVAAGDGEPALGRIENMGLRDSGFTLSGDYAGIPKWLKEIAPSAWPRRSIEGAYNRRCSLGHTHPFVIDGVSLLGVTRPGVGTLKPLSNLDDVKQLYGLAASADPDRGEVRIAATITGDLVLAHLPGKHDQDNHGDGGSRSASSAGKSSTVKPASAPKDKLKLAGRIKLASGQSLAASDAISTDHGLALFAALRTPDGPRLRIGLSIDDEDKRRWSAANRGQTAELDAKGVDEFRDALGAMWEAGERDLARYRELEARDKALDRRERELIRSQYPKLNKAQGRELDKLDEKIEQSQHEIARLDRRQQGRVDRLPEDLQAKYATASPEERQRIVADWHEAQPEWKGIVSFWQRRDAAERAQEEHTLSRLQARREELTAESAPLTAEAASELAAVRRERAELNTAFDDFDTLEGVVNGPWGDLTYTTYVEEGRAHRFLDFRTPDGEMLGEPISLTPALIRKLDAVLADLLDTAGGRVRAAAEVHAGAMVALIPTAEDAERLAVEAGEPAEQLHVTLAYLGDAVDLGSADRQDIVDAVSTAVNGAPVIEADGFALSVFNPPGALRDGKQRDSCIVLGLSGDDLDLIHTLVGDALAAADAVLPVQRTPWHAHMTLLYTSDIEWLAELVDRAGTVRFDRVRIALAGQHIDIPLIAESMAAEPDASEAVAAATADEDSLKRYWTATPEGLAKWRDSPHPWTALYRQIRKHLGAERARRIASQWFTEVFGYSPGSRKGNNPTGPG